MIRGLEHVLYEKKKVKGVGIVQSGEEKDPGIPSNILRAGKLFHPQLF